MPKPVRYHQCTMAIEPSRRSAVLIATTALATLPAVAQAAADLNENAKSADIGIVSDKDYLAGNDDAMAAIARRTAERNAIAARAKGYGKTAEELRAEQEESKSKIIQVAVGGTVASTAFFLSEPRTPLHKNNERRAGQRLWHSIGPSLSEESCCKESWQSGCKTIEKAGKRELLPQAIKGRESEVKLQVTIHDPPPHTHTHPAHFAHPLISPIPIATAK